MGTRRGQRRERRLERQADNATNQWQPTQIEQEQLARTRGLLNDLDSGKDVKDIQGLNSHLNLFNSAVNRENNEKGAGILSGNLLSGGNTKVGGLISAQNKARQKQQAQGDLYNSVNTARHEAQNITSPFLINTANQRLGGRAQLANQRYNSYLQRPRRPGLFGQILGAGVGAVRGGF